MSRASKTPFLFWKAFSAAYKVPRGICKVRPTNTVAHVVCVENVWDAFQIDVVSCALIRKSKKKSWSVCQEASRVRQMISVYSSSDPSSPFKHEKFMCGAFGSMLHFKPKPQSFARRQTVIRAGPLNPADAFLSVCLYLRWRRSHGHNLKIAGMVIPNCVFTGMFEEDVLEAVRSKIRERPNATYSDKFPGVALTLDGTRVVPEVYTRRGTFIAPGVSTTHDLNTSLQGLAAVYS